MKPAPMLALTSLIGSTKPDGAPFMDGTCEKEYCVFAMHIGRLEKPCLVYISICFSAYRKNTEKSAQHDKNLLVLTIMQ